MFPWNIAKSAEAMFSRWALKRLCKFLLKKKLGQFLLGDIDLDQLDVQLTQGTIQLSDLALNVDYINEKLGAAASLMIKEGSVGSLLVRLPWKVKGCQVEVDELELVLAPCAEYNLRAGAETCNSGQDGNGDLHCDAGHDVIEKAAKSTSADVHQGVKTIANMVKEFLTSFHVKIKKLIVAFDPYSHKDEKKSGSHTALVLRISETECGTCVSDYANPKPKTQAGSFLGISQLTNFVKFEGAIFELLQMDGFENKTCFPHTETTLGESLTECCSSSVTTPILTGKKGGFSGNVKLSIPWENGSLDIRKVDADVSIDPVDLKFQPSTIKWLLHSWEKFNKLEKNGNDSILNKSTDTVHLTSVSNCHSSKPVSTAFPVNKVVPIHGGFSTDLSSLTMKECVAEAVLPGPHLISDWVPLYSDRSQKVGAEELDFGASVDQFFECFDGMRSSQSVLGSSGMWNWTLFSAITAASSLASGSLHVPSEQQHVETNLKATFAGISVFLSFQDENKKYPCDKGDQINAASYIPHLGAECRDIQLGVQVCPQEMRFEGTLKYLEIIHCLHYKDGDVDSGLQGFNDDNNSQMQKIQRLQEDVQDALPSLASSVECSDKLNCLAVEDFPFGNRNNVFKVTMLKTSGVTYCQFTVKSSSLNSCPMGHTSFSVKLPPFVFWVDFPLINMLLELFKEIGKSFEKPGVFPSETFNEKHGSSHGDVERGSSSCIAALSSTESVQGNISLHSARVILCFPLGSDKDIRRFSSWDQFVALDFSLPSADNRKTYQDSGLGGRSQKRYSSTTTCSIHLNFANLDIFLINPASKNHVGIYSSNMQRQKFSAENILSASNRTDYLSVISMCLQEGLVTGPWIAKRAKLLATFEDSKSGNNSVGKGYEFASVSTVKDMEDLNSQTREEIILSSAILLHVHLPAVTVKLGSPQYQGLCCLLDKMVSGLSCVTPAGDNVKAESTMSQTSILVDCDDAEFLISPELKENIKVSIQRELPGSWCHLKLKIQKFCLLSVSNIGGNKGANFFWLAHNEGKLWGSITGVPEQEFLLISCSNSAMKRGDGGGSNALSCRLAGSDIIYLWEPESFHGFTSITVRCGTLVAAGGRLDWLDAIFSFFSVSSTEIEQNEKRLQNGDLDAPCGSSFVLNLVDIGLSYEPYVKNGEAKSEVFSNGKEQVGEEYVACLLAASSLNLSNSAVAGSMENEYKIRIQDLGLLLCMVSECDNLCGSYGAEHLHKIGYVKIAQEALVEAILRTNCKSGLLWEVECSKSHIHVDTCGDTTSSMIRLAAQLQQLFAPDLEESVVHLQTRWNKVQQEQERKWLNDEIRFSDGHSATSISERSSSSVGIQTDPGSVGLMDEIREDAFHVSTNEIYPHGSSELQSHISHDENFLEELDNISFDSLSSNQSFNGLVPVIEMESSQTSSFIEGNLPEFIEGYCLTELQPIELSIGGKSSHEIHKCSSGDVGSGDLGGEINGWYRDASFRIVEDHVLKASEGCSVSKYEEDQLSSIDNDKANNLTKAIGRLLLKNINIRWRMHAGFDWHYCRKNGRQPKNGGGRDTTVCLELSLSGMEFQYDMFPVGEIHVSKLSLSVQDFYLDDRSRDAPWKLVLGYYCSKDHPRKSSSKAFKLDLESVRPDPLTPLEEYRLRIAFLPMRLHLHQRQLDFLITFFGAKSSSVDQSPGHHKDSDGSTSLPVMSNTVAGHSTSVEEAFLPYFQAIDIWPILIRVDYSPCRVDLPALGGGKYVELVNLVPWKGVELQLKHVHAVGIYGWGSVCETIVGEWLEDISQNQIHKILQGLPAVRSLVAVGAGATKLVSMPIENYRKDKRLLKGMQRGATAFLRSISLEAIGLGVHLAAGAHNILLQAEYLSTTISPSIPWPIPSKLKTNVRFNQPKDAQQGIEQAYESLSDGLGKSASALVRTPLKNFQRGASAGSALASAVRAVPAAAIAPVSACASALHYTLLGVRNSLDPQHKKESMEKYLGPTQQWEQN
ncbi:autophagy-related protein 2 isoform X1 [Ziziphus jujuba]|uniref:Autophagy-related protein 2 n=1 Tax=Ziziphus jujuba TaxID=326968 RepID=A0ABM4AIA6_ZIZJJ|nr:autophagy-related protein 2 isoform X1 [Ziziphus jujuba]XP_060676469.1 autophagy-related protein 2 isoform X1 [Ziziphus jujuba]